MEVILLERVGRLGTTGDVVKVKNGFARNFLIPQKKALRATESNKVDFESRRSTILAQNNELKAAAEKKAKAMQGISLVIVRQASEDGKLYGSVALRDIAQALTDQGHNIERKAIVLNSSIKNTGIYSASIILHPEVILPVSVNVVRNESDAEAAVAAQELLETAPEEAVAE